MRLPRTTGAKEHEPSPRIHCKVNARLKGLLHPRDARIERLKGGFAQGSQVRRLAPLLEAQQPLSLFNTGTRTTFPKGRISDRRRHPKPFLAATQRTCALGDVHVLFALPC